MFLCLSVYMYVCVTVYTSASSADVFSTNLSQVDARNLDVSRAAAIYKEHGCLVVRGLNRKYVDAINKDVEMHAEQAVRLIPQKERIAVRENENVHEIFIFPMKLLSFFVTQIELSRISKPSNFTQKFFS